MTTRSIDRIAGTFARGAIAGLVGTAAMTVSSTIEARVRGRGASDAPAQGMGAVLGVEPTEEGSGRFNQIAHWAYGTTLGTIRGGLGLVGLDGARAAAAHFATVIAAEQIVLPATGAAPPATQWGLREIAIDWWHHGVYAAATGLAYTALDHDSN